MPPSADPGAGQSTVLIRPGGTYSLPGSQFAVDPVWVSPNGEGGRDVTTFYAAFAPLCFTILGLWFVVVQTRHSVWIGSARHRRRASVVALQFALPGLMSLLSLVDPTSKVMWRACFATSAIVAALAIVAIFADLRRTRLYSVDLINGLSLLMFVLVAIVALDPSSIANIGLAATALQVEATLLSLLVFLGVVIAWVLLFEQAPEPDVTTPNDDAA